LVEDANSASLLGSVETTNTFNRHNIDGVIVEASKEVRSLQINVGKILVFTRDATAWTTTRTTMAAASFISLSYGIEMSIWYSKREASDANVKLTN
jgi:ABC-type proline/glycine betaine transport system permease subunit